jgi:hypothetical protein
MRTQGFLVSLLLSLAVGHVTANLVEPDDIPAGCEQRCQSTLDTSAACDAQFSNVDFLDRLEGERDCLCDAEGGQAFNTDCATCIAESTINEEDDRESKLSRLPPLLRDFGVSSRSKAPVCPRESRVYCHFPPTINIPFLEADTESRCT